MDNQQHDRTGKFNTTPRLSPTSYVYPVRSLLEGRFQSHPLAKASATSRSSDDVSGLVSQSREQKSPEKSIAASPLQFPTETYLKTPAGPPDPSSKHSKPTRQRAASTSSLHPISPENDGHKPPAKSKRKKSKSKPSPNFSHFPAGYNPYFPHTFSSFHQSVAISASQPSSVAHMEEMPSSMSAEHVLGHRIHASFQDIYDSDSDLPIAVGSALAMSSPSLLPGFDGEPPMRSPWEESLPMETVCKTSADAQRPSPSIEEFPSTPSFTMPPQEFYADVLATPIAQYPGKDSRTTKEDGNESYLPFNLSEYGLVHLPPLPSSRSNSDRASTGASSGQRSRRSAGRSSNSKTSNLESTRTSSLTGSGESSNFVTVPSGLDSGRLSSGPSQKESSSEIFSSDETGSNSISSEEPYVSFRFQTMQDENGNHVVVGREGKLLRCEDEVRHLLFLDVSIQRSIVQPICTPGAVQGFGVLIAIDELEDTLVVHQVSEVY